ncbi:hypothetical protein BCR43DRAFT_499888 [Syncephalastrum racemosum]|uniref:Mediator of RNA polymerase II transcription subunit 11 n=1 Tax=Syncephalastrum racemosum TaxID=13706 RepID=A0A1X2GZY7_SYNRA|nr:hypothetical protein BCR43DRAFT_499888 [Syncephalastrum racemosum]
MSQHESIEKQQQQEKQETAVDEYSYLAESTLRIRELHDAERKLVLLVETAGDALTVLSDDASKDADADQVVREHATAFRGLASRYFGLVNDIQRCLRDNVRYLQKSGSITSSTRESIPFHASVAGHQKELEVWTAAVGLIHQRVQVMNQIAHEKSSDTMSE